MVFQFLIGLLRLFYRLFVLLCRFFVLILETGFVYLLLHLSCFLCVQLLFLLFCSWRRGWGWDNFVAEVNQGQGVRFPRFMKYYLRYGLPCIILLVFVMGYVDKFGK